ncbi:MAG TPA: class I SAM-dependent methyltransferase, partial [Thermomicrobiales bacterium]|nr:class I SAM-dependent methyltransferase [Thermomicrobiales bacterium]
MDDAIARWRWLVRRREAAIAEIRARTGDTADYWTARAASFGRLMRAGGPNPALDFILPAIDGEATVLDVGAGSGRFAIPLARVARQVTAVEPSAALLGFLREDAAAAGIGPDRLGAVAATWEEAATPPADVVLCANVLTPIAEIAPFLRKLIAHARRRCYIVLRATPMDAPLVGLWRQIHGVPYPRETSHADAYAALNALGIAANVTILLSPSTIWTFASPADAARFARDRLWLGPEGLDQRADTLLANWLAA